MRRTGIALAATVFLAAAGHAQPAPDRSALDALIARTEAADVEADPAAYRTLAEQTVAEARRLFPAGHPEVAARTLYVAMARAAVGDMDQAQATLDPILPVLEKAAGYQRSWRDALSLRGYILNFRGDHAGALAIFSELVGLDESQPIPGRDKDKATALSNLAAALLEQGRLDEALDRNAQAVAIGLTLQPVPGDVAVWQANRVVYLYSAGRTDDAIAAANDGVARLSAAIGADHPSMANLYANQGAIMLRINRPRDAMLPIRKAFELSEKANGGPNQNSATMRVQFAQAMIRAGRHDEALAFLDGAVPIIDAQLGAQSDRALNARDTRLIALINSGKAAEAEILARELLAIRDARLPEGHRDRANTRDNLAKAAMAQGKWAAAREAAAESVTLRQKMLPPEHPDLLLARSYLLLVEDRGGIRSSAELVEAARTLLDALIFNAGLARGPAQAERQRPAYGWLAEILARHGDVDAAFRAQQWAARTSLDDTLAVAAVERAAAGDPALAAALAERRTLVSARIGLEARVEGNMARPDPAFDLAGLTRELEVNRQNLAERDAALPPAYRAKLLFAPVKMTQAQEASVGQSAYAMITDIGEGWLVTAFRGRKVAQILVGANAPVDALVMRLRTSAAPGNERGLDRAAAGELADLLLPGQIGTMVRSARRLTVVANGALGALPFGLLGMDRAGRSLLLDRMTVVRGLGTQQASMDTPVEQRSLIALGGVTGQRVGAVMAMRSTGTARTLNELPDLPEAQRELAALAQAIGADGARLLIGEEATEKALRQLTVPSGGILAFATHGLLSGELDGLTEPALVLTPADGDDGLLKPSEIGGMRLPAGLVILSACNTAGASGTDRPQLSGLVQGFLLAGAQRVLASHWPVRDDASRRLSVAMVRGMKSGADPAEAFSKAIAAVRSGSDGEAPLTDPALWAAFELFETNGR